MLCALSRGSSLSFVKSDGVNRSITPYLGAIFFDKCPQSPPNGLFVHPNVSLGFLGVGRELFPVCSACHTCGTPNLTLDGPWKFPKRLGKRLENDPKPVTNTFFEK